MRYGTVALVLLLAAVGWAATMALLSLLSRRPENLGAREGKLAVCPGSPNCVCSGDADAAHAALPLRFDDSPDEAWRRLGRVIDGWPRTRVVRRTDDYLHAECTSLLFRFVDDVEFLLDRPGRRIDFRSASRAGHSDFGVNRRRVEAIRAAFAGAGGES